MIWIILTSIRHNLFCHPRKFLSGIQNWLQAGCPIKAFGHDIKLRLCRTHVILAFIMLGSGCQMQPQERHYTEVILKAPQQDVPDPHAGMDMSGISMPSVTNNSSLKWQVPAGWQETAGSGMRLASFHLKDDPSSIDCSIVSLGGVAGGLEANLRRWMGQIGLQPSEAEFDQFIQSSQGIQTQNNQEAKVYDFTPLQKNTTGKSIVVAMITIDDATVFIKMTGSVEAIKQNRDEFLELVKSIKEK